VISLFNIVCPDGTDQCRVSHLYLSALTYRLKRYYLWSFWEAACATACVVTRGDAPIENVDIFGIETATTARHFWRSWNMQMQRWLYHSVYKRIGSKGTFWQSFRMLMTFLLCGLWVSRVSFVVLFPANFEPQHGARLRVWSEQDRDEECSEADCIRSMSCGEG
jgi:D-alanyl-lipoteichoic acid acyltransferase DltB (MBOAT superfamily)